MHDAVAPYRIPITGTSVLYPTTDGGASTTQTNSIFNVALTGRAVLAGILLTANAAGGTITIFKGDGTTAVHVQLVPAGCPPFIPLFGMSWAPIQVNSKANGGFAVQSSAGTLTATLVFRTEQ